MKKQSPSASCCEIPECKNGDIMKDKMVFKRYETKFMLTDADTELLYPLILEHMRGDEHKNKQICNIYFDTPDYRLIRASVEKPTFKEKLRLRSYGVPTEDDICYAEIKRKYKHTVYKRRIALPEGEAMQYLTGKTRAPEGQITREIDYMLEFYKNLAPVLYLSYEREAFFDKTDPTLRLTLDRNIIWRTENLRLSSGSYGTPLLAEGEVLMEIKSSGAIPLWLTSWLSERKIYKRSFSKYGTVYTQNLIQKRG